MYFVYDQESNECWPCTTQKDAMDRVTKRFLFWSDQGYSKELPNVVLFYYPIGDHNHVYRESEDLWQEIRNEL